MADFNGTTADDTFAGTAGPDTIFSGGGKDTLNGAGADDLIILDAPLTDGSLIDGGSGTDTLQLRNFATQRTIASYLVPQGIPSSGYSLFTSTISSIERIEFQSKTGTGMTATLGFGATAPFTTQFGATGISPTAELIGGGGRDSLVLVATVKSDAATVNVPAFVYTAWIESARVYDGNGDSVTVTVSGPATFGATINGSAHKGVQILNGGAGQDTINASDDMDILSPGDGGLNRLFGNGGNDGFAFINTIGTSVDANGKVTKETSALPSASGLSDGGAGFDFLMFGGKISFNGSVRNVEGIYLAPGYTNALVPGLTTTRLDAADVAIAGSTLADMPTDLLFDGVGTMAIDMGYVQGGFVYSIGLFDGSNYGFEAGSAIKFEFSGTDSSESVIGTSLGDTILGRDADDVIRGGAGNDTIDGGDGRDTAAFGGNRSAYTVTEQGAGSFTVKGADGTDALNSIEVFRFDDGDYAWNTGKGVLELLPPPTVPAGSFRVFAPTGFTGSIAGKGTVFGTSEPQYIAPFGEADNIVFDPSFNRGGDTIRLPRPTVEYTASRLGSSVVIADKYTSYTFPVGDQGLPITFLDDGRRLVLDTASGAVKLGDMVISTTPSPITGANQRAYPAGTLPDLAATARAFLTAGTEITVYGNYSVFGTATGKEEITWQGGDIVLDPSFNRGGDVLVVDAAAGEYSAYRSGSSLLLLRESRGDSATLPIGVKGVTIEFATSNGTADLRELTFDQATGAVRIGDQLITATTAAGANDLTAANFASFA